MSHIQHSPIAVSGDSIIDLRQRLANIRWPENQTTPHWEQGVPLNAMQNLCEYWQRHYDWRRCEAMLNGWNPSITTIDDLDIHFFHIQSPETDALPVIMTHGWPGSITEFHKVIGPLTDPARYGGDPSDAVHLVLGHRHWVMRWPIRR